MHVIQYIATKADSKDEAFRIVKDNLETQLGSGDTYNTWFDWFVTGGGRWSTSTDPYDDNYTNDVVHQSEPKFQEYLATSKKWRSEELEAYTKETRELNLSDILDKVDSAAQHNYLVASQLYPIKKLYDLLGGNWDYSSYYYDVTHDSSSMSHLEEAIDKGDNDWYLVPVDFHY